MAPYSQANLPRQLGSALRICPRITRTDHFYWVGRKLTAYRPIRRSLILQSNRLISGLALSAGLWWALVLGGATMLGGCDRSCSRLADKLCEQASMSGDKNAEEHCESWKARTKRVSKESCQTALKHLELQR